MNAERLDLDNTIFIIDSTTIAMMVSIIANGELVRCIFEKKQGIDTDYSFQLMKNFSSKCLKIKESKDIEVPSPFFLVEKGKVFKNIRKLITFKKEIKSRYEFERFTNYVGPLTSSLMNALECDEKYIYYLYHGTMDYIKAYKGIENNRSVKNYIKYLLYGKFVGLKNSQFACFFSYQGFSMTNIKQNGIKWLDYNNFRSTEIECFFKSLPEYEKFKNSSVFCPLSAFHNKDGIDSNTIRFNEKNIEMIKKVSGLQENILVKFHPSLYQLSGGKMINNLVEQMEKAGYSVNDIVDFLPDSIGGALIPLEVIIKYLRIKKIVCLESATVWNISHNKDIIKCLNITYSPNDRKELYRSIVENMEEMGIINDSFSIEI